MEPPLDHSGEFFTLTSPRGSAMEEVDSSDVDEGPPKPAGPTLQAPPMEEPKAKKPKLEAGAKEDGQGALLVDIDPDYPDEEMDGPVDHAAKFSGTAWRSPERERPMDPLSKDETHAQMDDQKRDQGKQDHSDTIPRSQSGLPISRSAANIEEFRVYECVKDEIRQNSDGPYQNYGSAALKDMIVYLIPDVNKCNVYCPGDGKLPMAYACLNYMCKDQGRVNGKLSPGEVKHRFDEDDLFHAFSLNAWLTLQFFDGTTIAQLASLRRKLITAIFDDVEPRIPAALAMEIYGSYISKFALLGRSMDADSEPKIMSESECQAWIGTHIKREHAADPGVMIVKPDRRPRVDDIRKIDDIRDIVCGFTTDDDGNVFSIANTVGKWDDSEYSKTMKHAKSRAGVEVRYGDSIGVTGIPDWATGNIDRNYLDMFTAEMHPWVYDDMPFREICQGDAHLAKCCASSPDDAKQKLFDKLVYGGYAGAAAVISNKDHRKDGFGTQGLYLSWTHYVDGWSFTEVMRECKQGKWSHLFEDGNRELRGRNANQLKAMKSFESGLQKVYTFFQSCYDLEDNPAYVWGNSEKGTLANTRHIFQARLPPVKVNGDWELREWVDNLTSQSRSVNKLCNTFIYAEPMWWHCSVCYQWHIRKAKIPMHRSELNGLLVSPEQASQKSVADALIPFILTGTPITFHATITFDGTQGKKSWTLVDLQLTSDAAYLIQKAKATMEGGPTRDPPGVYGWRQSRFDDGPTSLYPRTTAQRASTSEGRVEAYTCHERSVYRAPMEYGKKYVDLAPHMRWSARKDERVSSRDDQQKWVQYGTTFPKESLYSMTHAAYDVNGTPVSNSSRSILNRAPNTHYIHYLNASKIAARDGKYVRWHRDHYFTRRLVSCRAIQDDQDRTGCQHLEQFVRTHFDDMKWDDQKYWRPIQDHIENKTVGYSIIRGYPVYSDAWNDPLAGISDDQHLDQHFLVKYEDGSGSPIETPEDCHYMQTLIVTQNAREFNKLTSCWKAIIANGGGKTGNQRIRKYVDVDDVLGLLKNCLGVRFKLTKGFLFRGADVFTAMLPNKDHRYFGFFLKGRVAVAEKDQDEWCVSDSDGDGPTKKDRAVRKDHSTPHGDQPDAQAMMKKGYKFPECDKDWPEQLMNRMYMKPSSSDAKILRQSYSPADLSKIIPVAMRDWVQAARILQINKDTRIIHLDASILMGYPNAELKTMREGDEKTMLKVLPREKTTEGTAFAARTTKALLSTLPVYLPASAGGRHCLPAYRDFDTENLSEEITRAVGRAKHLMQVQELRKIVPKTSTDNWAGEWSKEFQTTFVSTGLPVDDTPIGLLRRSGYGITPFDVKEYSDTELCAPFSKRLDNEGVASGFTCFPPSIIQVLPKELLMVYRAHLTYMQSGRKTEDTLPKLTARTTLCPVCRLHHRDIICPICGRPDLDHYEWKAYTLTICHEGTDGKKVNQDGLSMILTQKPVSTDYDGGKLDPPAKPDDQEFTAVDRAQIEFKRDIYQKSIRQLTHGRLLCPIAIRIADLTRSSAARDQASDKTGLLDLAHSQVQGPPIYTDISEVFAVSTIAGDVLQMLQQIAAADPLDYEKHQGLPMAVRKHCFRLEVAIVELARATEAANAAMECANEQLGQVIEERDGLVSQNAALVKGAGLIEEEILGKIDDALKGDAAKATKEIRAICTYLINTYIRDHLHAVQELEKSLGEYSADVELWKSRAETMKRERLYQHRQANLQRNLNLAQAVAHDTMFTEVYNQDALVKLADQRTQDALQARVLLTQTQAVLAQVMKDKLELEGKNDEDNRRFTRLAEMWEVEKADLRTKYMAELNSQKKRADDLETRVANMQEENRKLQEQLKEKEDVVESTTSTKAAFAIRFMHACRYCTMEGLQSVVHYTQLLRSDMHQVKNILTVHDEPGSKIFDYFKDTFEPHMDKMMRSIRNAEAGMNPPTRFTFEIDPSQIKVGSLAETQHHVQQQIAGTMSIPEAIDHTKVFAAHPWMRWPTADYDADLLDHSRWGDPEHVAQWKEYIIGGDAHRTHKRERYPCELVDTAHAVVGLDGKTVDGVEHWHFKPDKSSARSEGASVAE